MLYNLQEGSFISTPNHQEILSKKPPDNCPVCLKSEQKEDEANPSRIADGEGFSFMGENYHLEDFVLVRSAACPHEEPPNTCASCKRVQPGIIGQIIDIKWAMHARHFDKNNVTIRMLGRISDIYEVVNRPSEVIRDEVGDFYVLNLLCLTLISCHRNISFLPTWNRIFPSQTLSESSTSHTRVPYLLQTLPLSSSSHLGIFMLSMLLHITRFRDGGKSEDCQSKIFWFAPVVSKISYIRRRRLKNSWLLRKAV